MQEEELISKKDLLLRTGISYGQLYRWKRQNLIPDAWFIKKSTYTGQETYFPKQKILERIRDIERMRDTHTFEEMAVIFSPMRMNRTFVLLDVAGAMGMSEATAYLCIRIWEKLRFAFHELVLIDLLTAMQHDLELDEKDRETWLRTARQWASRLDREDMQVLVYRKLGATFFMLAETAGAIFTDADSRLAAVYHLAERSKLLNMKLQEVVQS